MIQQKPEQPAGFLRRRRHAIISFVTMGRRLAGSGKTFHAGLAWWANLMAQLLRLAGMN
jgi:hypothetical protein